MGAGGALPPKPEIVAPGRLTSSKLDSTWRRHARAPSYGPNALWRIPRPIRTGAFLMEAAVDEAEVDDWLIEEILDLLNDALGG